MMCLLAAVATAAQERHGHGNEELAPPLAGYGDAYRRMLLESPVNTDAEQNQAAERGAREMTEVLRGSTALLLDHLQGVLRDLVFVADSLDTALKDVIVEKFNAGDRTMTERTVEQITETKQVLSGLGFLFTPERGEKHADPNERSVMMPGSPPGVVS